MLSYKEFKKNYSEECKQLGRKYDRKELSKFWGDYKEANEIFEKSINKLEELAKDEELFNHRTQPKAGSHAEQTGDLRPAGSNAENQ